MALQSDASNTGQLRCLSADKRHDEHGKCNAPRPMAVDNGSKLHSTRRDEVKDSTNRLPIQAQDRIQYGEDPRSQHAFPGGLPGTSYSARNESINPKDMANDLGIDLNVVSSHKPIMLPVLGNENDKTKSSSDNTESGEEALGRLTDKLNREEHNRNTRNEDFTYNKDLTLLSAPLEIKALEAVPPKLDDGAPVARPSASMQLMKFRTAVDLAGEDFETVESDSSSNSSLSDADEDDDDGIVHDWLSDDIPTFPNAKSEATLRHHSVSREKLLTRDKFQLQFPQSMSGSPESFHSSLPLLMPVLARGVPSPPRYPPPSNPCTPNASPLSKPQTHSIIYCRDNASPSKNLPVVQVSMSPPRHGVYQHCISHPGSAEFIPMMIPDQPKPVSSAGGIPILDTKIVKKKRAELPQHNLPHPKPKFGDWLNSRTMINNYIILESLGAGSYAEVRLCKEKFSGKMFAMKFIGRDVMKKDKLGQQSKLDDIKREVEIMKKLNHPNVIRLYEVMDDPKMNKLFVVIEYMKHGDLLSYQKKKKERRGSACSTISDRDLHSVFLQVILGVAYLHDQNIVHGDIKPHNLLVGENDIVKIGDFGISQSVYGSQQLITDTAGTPAFMAPEMCAGGEFSGQLADIWALGATMFMLKFGTPPFVAPNAMALFEKIQSDPLVFPSPVDDPYLEDLLRGMLTKKPADRFTLLKVMTHPWLTKDEHSGTFRTHNGQAENSSPILKTQAMGQLQSTRRKSVQKLMTDRRTDDALTRDELEEKSASAVSTTIGKHARGEKEDESKVLSEEEIQLRSQRFLRQKASGSAAGLTHSPRCFQNSCDTATGTNKEDNLADAADNSVDLDEGELSSDDDDDSPVVHQSPQLLDELLLSTLSLPPLPGHGDNKEKAEMHYKCSDSPTDLSKIGPGRSDLCVDPQQYCSASQHLPLAFGASSLLGRRSAQEDRWVVIPDAHEAYQHKATNAISFVGVYDGHGGDACANYTLQSLEKRILSTLTQKTQVAKHLEAAFLDMDTQACQHLQQKEDLSGSTATCVVFFKSPESSHIEAHIGHVGDCRLVLRKLDGTVMCITEDHRPELEREKQRVLGLGGKIFNNRVNGVITITRAFGDIEFKGMMPSGVLARNLSGKALLTAHPDIYSIALDPSEDELLVLACDGLWEVLSSEEAVQLAHDRLSLHGDLKLATQELAQEALRRYTNDNITVIIIRLNESKDATVPT